MEVARPVDFTQLTAILDSLPDAAAFLSPQQQLAGIVRSALKV